jgi:xylan 1,4-beta-xylosidase
MPDTAAPPFAGNISFNANHSPMGAFLSFTCGHFGTKGGFGLQNGRPGNQDLYIGIKAGDRASDAPLKVLPFYQGADVDEAARYDVEKAAGQQKKPGMITYAREQIRRHYGWASDTWVTDDFEFVIHSPFGPIPDSAMPAVTRDALCPAVVAELIVHNRSDQPKVGVFAMRFDERGARLLDSGVGPRRAGFALGYRYGVLGELQGDGQLQPIMRWSPEQAMRDANAVHLLGSAPGLTFDVPPRSSRRLRLALGCYLGESVTTRLEGRYLYSRLFTGLKDVLSYALDTFDSRKKQSQALDHQLMQSKLTPDQQFLVAHATRSYYNSTQLLDVGGEPFWIVNEGEYCMMNTLDLSVDHVFWELKQNPWVVRNLLDNFVRYYSYVDQVKVPKRQARRHEGTEARSGFVAMTDDEAISGTPRVLGETRSLDEFDLKPGGISFCHDMGVNNNFSAFGHSSYELPNLVGCFSYMTAEQLCNWTLMAACYVAKTKDEAWLRQNQPIVEACLTSFLNRGGEAGFCQYDSSRCLTGAEITTFDSLDHSLAQTRANVYMATKTWASYLGLARLLERIASPRAREALEAAARVEKAVTAAAGPDGVLPAVFEKDNPGNKSRILPAIEGLMYPLCWNDPALREPSPFLDALKRHTSALLQAGTNVFEDGGIKRSSTSNNSWMSKIAIFMHVARRVLKLDADPQVKAIFAKADAAHVKWQTETQGVDGSAYWACSDQMVSGIAKGSKYYPRIITAALWME